MNEIEKLVPEKYRGYVLFGLAVAPYFTRALYRLRCGGGVRGMLRSIWLGDNTQAAKPLTPATIEPRVNA